MTTGQDHKDLLALTAAVRKLFTLTDERPPEEATAYSFDLERLNDKILKRLASHDK